MAARVCVVWHSLLKSKAAECRPFLEVQNFASQDSFITAVEKLARRYKQRDVQFVLNLLGEASSKVNDFAVAASAPFPGELSAEDILDPLWNIAYALIKVMDSALLLYRCTDTEKKGLSLKLTFSNVANYVTQLDEQIPDVEACDAVFANIAELHRPLQDIFARHVDSYLEAIKLLERETKPDIDQCITESQTQFESWKDQYMMLKRISAQLVRTLGKPEATPLHFDIEPGEPIGSHSTFSRVFAAHQKSTKQDYAVKRIPASASASSLTSPESVLSEIKIMRKLSHHHIATLAFALREPQHFSLYITPRAECDLSQYLDLGGDGTSYAEDDVWMWFGCLLAALDYAHRNDVKHKDIKPENILIDEKGRRVLLTDFGLSRDFSALESSMSTGSPPRGTDNYFAPECRFDGERTTLVDVFALGCVFAEILGAIAGLSREVFRQKRIEWGGEQFRKCVEQVQKSWLPDLKSHFAKRDTSRHRVASETSRMLEEEAERRSEAAEALDHMKAPDFRCPRC